MTDLMSGAEMQSGQDSPTVGEMQYDEARKLEAFVDEMRNLGVPLGTS